LEFIILNSINATLLRRVCYWLLSDSRLLGTFSEASWWHELFEVTKGVR